MKTFVYVSNAQGESVSVLSLDEASGALTVVQELALGGQIMPLALSTQRNMLYAARRSEPMAIISLAIDLQLGTLSLRGQSPLPASMPHIALDATERWLLCASYQSGVVAVCAISEDGIAQAAHQVLDSGEKTHAIRTTPDNQRAIAAVLGTDQVINYSFDADRGLLQDPYILDLPSGCGPRHIAIHPISNAAWVIGELDGQVYPLQLNGIKLSRVTAATVSTLPGSFSGTPWAADLRLAPNGRFLYASERRSSTLTLIDVTSAKAEICGQWPTQNEPRGFAITSNGRWLICAGQGSNQVGVHGIGANGDLTFITEIAVGQGPNWVETLTLLS